MAAACSEDGLKVRRRAERKSHSHSVQRIGQSRLTLVVCGGRLLIALSVALTLILIPLRLWLLVLLLMGIRVVLLLLVAALLWLAILIALRLIAVVQLSIRIRLLIVRNGLSSTHHRREIGRRLSGLGRLGVGVVSWLLLLIVPVLLLIQA